MGKSESSSRDARNANRRLRRSSAKKQKMAAAAIHRRVQRGADERKRKKKSRELQQRAKAIAMYVARFDPLSAHQSKDRQLRQQNSARTSPLGSCNPTHRYEKVQNQAYLSAQEKGDIFCDFETKCQGMRHNRCGCCRMVRIAMDVNSSSICKKCSTRKDNTYYLRNKALPVWYTKEGNPQYQLPPELQGLSHAEKMLIQRVSPFVPLIHIKYGTFGLSGHVCAFEQDIDKYYSRLPRQKGDVAMLKVLQSVRAEIGTFNKSAAIKAFRVRRAKVLAALGFLKEYNSLYQDIEIDAAALDWIEGEEGVLDCAEMQVEELLADGDRRHSRER